MAQVKEEANAHYQALLEMLSTIHAAGPADAAAPEAAANVLVHNRALLRNKRLLLAYVCVPRESRFQRTARFLFRFPASFVSLFSLSRELRRRNARMARVKALRWSVGANLPEELLAPLSPSECDFFKSYSRRASSRLNSPKSRIRALYLTHRPLRLLGTYMGRTGINLNLTLDPSPPKQHKIEVRVLQDIGSMWFRDGEVHLAARSTHLLWRDEAQALIAEGLVEKVSD